MAVECWEFRGLVQGVGFRWFVRQHARARGISGWVKNEKSGAVRVAARGDAATLEQFLSDIRTGPTGARVDQVLTLPAEEAGDLPDSFTIIR